MPLWAALDFSSRCIHRLSGARHTNGVGVSFKSCIFKRERRTQILHPGRKPHQCLCLSFPALPKEAGNWTGTRREQEKRKREGVGEEEEGEVIFNPSFLLSSMPPGRFACQPSGFRCLVVAPRHEGGWGRSNRCPPKTLDRLLASFLRAWVLGVGGSSGAGGRRCSTAVRAPDWPGAGHRRGRDARGGRGCAERRLRGPCAHASEVGARVACRSQAPRLDALRGQA